MAGEMLCGDRMAHKKMSFVEAFLRPDLGAHRRLERIERMIDWARCFGSPPILRSVSATMRNRMA